MTVYPDLEFPAALPERPYVFINMVSTIDGKTISGERHEPVTQLGSRRDHATMHDLERHAQAILIGAETVRATPVINWPAGVLRLAASRTGRLDPQASFFQCPTGEAWVVLPQDAVAGATPGLPLWPVGQSEMDWETFLRELRILKKVTHLLVEGGSEINAEFLRRDLVDELFLTLAPKIRLGRDLPTYAGGEPLPPGHLMNFDLASCHPVENEVFLRYRRRTA